MGQNQHNPELAIFDHAPRFEMPLHVGRPNIVHQDRFLKRAAEIVERGWLTNNGPVVQEFEKQVADFVGVKHCVAMCNGTVALEIAIRATELTGEVIVPAYTFVATAHSLKWQEITPVFCDIDPISHTIDPQQIERLITPKTSAIIGVHLWGHPCQIDELQTIADRNGLHLLFDAAHAFGCSYKGNKIGRFGTAEVFSFHATKFLNTLEGGAIVTNDDQLAKKVRLMHNFGFAGYDDVVYIGTNGKMNEISAAMGLTSLEGCDEIVAANRRNYHAYSGEVADIDGISICEYNEGEQNNYQYIVLEIDDSICPLSRDELHQVLQAENVLARRYFYPGCHRMEPYRSNSQYAEVSLPVTDKVGSRVLVMPNGLSIGELEIGQIGELIKTAIGHAEQVREKLA